MKNDPIQTMLDEHEVISSTVELVRSIDELWNDDVERFKEVTVKLVTFYREYADAYHHRKEEEVLFPAIKNHPDFVLQEMIDEFEQHHEEFRGYSTEILEALYAEEYKKVYNEMKSYTEDLLDHIGAENDELFSMAENLLSEEELETIYFKFKDIDVELGEDRKKELEDGISILIETV